jgi:hypothetical protein
MPSNVKIFWWLSVAVVAYWAVMTAWHAMFPSAHELAVLAKMPAELRDKVRRTDTSIPILTTAFWSAVTLGLAWLAAFRRQNWARWAYAFAFVVREFLLPWIVVAYVYLVQSTGAHYWGALWEDAWNSTFSLSSDPRHYIVPALTIAAIAAVFMGNAKDWFRAPRTAK